MKQTKTIRLVIEAVVEQETELTPEVVRRLWTYQNVEEMLAEPYWQENIRQQQVLLDALLTDPAKYRVLLLLALQYELENTGTDFFKLAGVDTRNQPIQEFDPVEDMVATLPPATAEYFQRMKQEGYFSERTELITHSSQVALTGIRVEEVE